MGKFFTVDVSPDIVAGDISTIQASNKAHVDLDANDIIFDWTAVEIPDTCRLLGVTAVLNGEDGTAMSTTRDVELIFAKPSASGVAPTTIGTVNATATALGVMDNIMKLGAIATGIAGIVMLVQKLVSMTVDASPMLPQMVKLFNYSVMLILRPIGDFFGFFLRPLVVYFLRTIALPFYRQWRPIMIGLASWLGQQALENLDSNRKGGEAILAGDWDTVVEEAEKGTEKLQNH